MESLYAITTGVLSACGLYLTLRGRTFPVVVGLTLLSYAVNLFLFSMGGLTTNGATIIDGARDFCNRRGMSYIMTSTENPVETLVSNYLRQRGLVR